MQAAAMHDHLQDRIYEVSPDQFEVLCKMVLVRRLDTESLEVTAFRQDEGIDIEGIIDEGIIRAWLGVQVKQYSEGNTVGLGSLQRFRGALARGDHQIGTYITSSSFTGPAVEEADDAQLCLVDGGTLAGIMVDSGIGITETSAGLETAPEFWQAFEKPEQEDVVPSNEVPLANSFETLRLFLRAIDATDGSKEKITSYVNTELGESFAARHADLYGTAGWLLGFVHKDTPKIVDNREVRRWGLTRGGVEYLALHDSGDETSATALLADAIRNVEIVQRIYADLGENGELGYDDVRGIMASETTLSESSVQRRASTVVQWLTVLPDVTVERDGRSKKVVRR
ncbi:restriction endonuclease [Halomicrobium urmianum]|uniref:restriction endonuclease n=1 Tax=Halomicrobium urmianum TaxID=1586233 RepID=UPI001CDA45C4|nr:restriction endonuclease [Halomicrobium urmianum]